MGLTRAQRRRRKFFKVLRSGGLKAVRTYLQAFLGTFYGLPLFDVNVATWKAAAAAGIAALIALVMRWLDETPIPTIPAG